MTDKGLHVNAPRHGAVLLSFTLAIALLLSAVQLLSAQEVERTPPQLSGSSKSVDQAEAQPGETVRYTIVVSNAGSPTLVTLTDTLGVDLTYAGGFSENPAGGVHTVTNGTLVWSGFAGAVPVTLSFDATLDGGLAAGAGVTNTVLIAANGAQVNRSAHTTVVTDTTYVMHLPFLAHFLASPTLFASPPNSANQWTMAWTPVTGNGVTGYILQESQTPDFAVISNEYVVGLVTEQLIANALSTNNAYYYRIRAVAGAVQSPWSNVVEIIGGYRDDFNDPASGWALRRTSFLEKTIMFYGAGNEAGNLIIIVDDRWDWMIASPLKRAPAVPYDITYRARVHDASNLVSGGFTFGGDWNGGACPDFSNVYEHVNCFNRFHNLNFIFYGPLKLLYEHIDQLVWCPTCGGSLLKRIGNTVDVGDMIPNGPSKEFHDYRIEVRSDGARVYIDGILRYHYTDTSYLDQPYFGVFASTEEYKPSIWFYDYVQIVPAN